MSLASQITSQASNGSSSTSYSLNYFNRVGKIDLVRLIFTAANVTYQDNYIENLTDSDVQIGLLPFLEVKDVRIPLISVISRYLAREFNLAGKNNLDQAKADAISQSVMLLIDSYYRNVHSQDDLDQKRIALKAFIASDVENSAIEIEKLIKMYSTNLDDGYCVGDSLTYADLFVYEMAAHYFPTESSFTNRFPNIYKIKTNVEKIPAINDYVKSDELRRVGFIREF